jgi:hypothetical protein
VQKAWSSTAAKTDVSMTWGEQSYQARAGLVLGGLECHIVPSSLAIDGGYDDSCPFLSLRNIFRHASVSHGYFIGVSILASCSRYKRFNYDRPISGRQKTLVAQISVHTAKGSDGMG